jgi:predicted ArsR family transcriptional regulator
MMQPNDSRAARSDQAVLRALTEGWATTAQISGAADLHRATVRVVLDRLEVAGLVEQGEPKHSGQRGRPERTYRRRA